MKLALAALCSECGQPRPVLGPGLCPECGSPLDAEHVRQVRAAIRARRNAFKVMVQRLRERIGALGDALAEFKTDGVPLSPAEHLDQVLLPAMSVSNERTTKVGQLLEARVWDPEEAGTVAAFGELVKELDDGLAWVASLRDTMPPIEWRAVHRETVRTAMATLDTADGSAWVIEHALLVERMWLGLDRISRETERIGADWRHGLPRRHVMRTLTEAYRELVEGALCDLGGIILIAARAGRCEPDGAYEKATVDGIKSGEVVSELIRQGRPCTDGVNMLYRNASAHASVTLTDTGIIATQREIRDGRVLSSKTAELTDEQFNEQLVELLELLLALELALLPWATGHADPDLAGALAAAAPSELQRDQTIALLAGLAGLSDVSVTLKDGDMTVVANAPATLPDDSAFSVLSLVPAAFGTKPKPTRVTLSISGSQPVSFSPEEFGYDDAGEQAHTLALTGLVSAKWLVESRGRFGAREEAIYVTAPLTLFRAECEQLATSDLDAALRSAERVRKRVDAVLTVERRSPATRSALEQIDALSARLRSSSPG